MIYLNKWDPNYTMYSFLVVYLWMVIWYSSANILPHPMLQLWLIAKKTMWMTALLSVLILFVFQLLSLAQPLVTASIQISLTAASTFNAMVANYTIKGVPWDSYLIQKSRPVIGPRTWCAHKCSTGINTNDGRDVLGFQWLNKNPQK